MENTAAIRTGTNNARGARATFRASIKSIARGASANHPVNSGRGQARPQHGYEVIDTEGRPATCLVWFD